MRSSTKDKLIYMFWFLFAIGYALGIVLLAFDNAWVLWLAVALAAVIPFGLAFIFVSILDNMADDRKAKRRREDERVRREAHFKDIKRNVHVGDGNAQDAQVEAIIREEGRVANIANIKAMIDYYKNSIADSKCHIQDLEDALKVCGAVAHSEGCEAPKHE